MSGFRAIIVVVCCLVAFACAPVGGPAAERLYVAPMKLELREQLGLQSKVSGIALHGDRVLVMERRRRFARVRLEGGGAMGWVDSAELLSEQQWAKLDRLAMQAASLPLQAAAAPFDALNVHTDPNRQAPSFYVTAAEEPVEIVGHMVTPRVEHDPLFAAGYDPALVTPGTPVDDWHLIRVTRPGDDPGVPKRAGWVLSRLLFIRLPDSVTQQANGAPIMAALPLGAVEDEGERRVHWLMATVGSRNQPYEYNTLRVLVWNVSRHRYDVTFLQKDLAGYYPIQLEPPSPTQTERSSLSGFSLLVQTGELERERRHFAFQKGSNRPKLISTETITLPKPEAPRREDYVAPLPVAPVEPAEPPYWERVRKRWREAWRSAT